MIYAGTSIGVTNGGLVLESGPFVMRTGATPVPRSNLEQEQAR